MIDRVDMKHFNPRSYKIINPDCFAFPLNSHGTNWNIYKPATKGIYYPKVTLKRYFDNSNNSNRIITVLDIDCNLPKLLYGNNLYELTDNDLIPVCDTLHNRLLDMGVEMNIPQILMGNIAQVEISKNIPTGSVPVCFILEEMYKAQRLNNFMDVQRVSYRNTGEQLSFHNDGYEIVFYDKAAEMKHVVTNNSDICSETLTNRILSGQLNVLRMEVRFDDHKKLNDFLQEHNLTTNTRLKDVFSQEISKYVLNHYWHELSDTARLVSPSLFSLGFELQQIHNGGGANLKPQRTLAKLAVRCLLREYGYKGTTRVLNLIGCTNPSQILRQYVSRVFKLPRQLDIWKFIDRALSSFKLLTPDKWKHVRLKAFAPWFKKEEQLLTVRDLATWFKVSVKTIRKKIKATKLKAIPISGNTYRIKRADALEYLYGQHG